MSLRVGIPGSSLHDTSRTRSSHLLVGTTIAFTQLNRLLRTPHTDDGTRGWTGGKGNGQGLHVSLWIDVVQVRTAGGRQGTVKGREFCGSGYERTRLGDAGERCTSLEGFGKTGASQFSREPKGGFMWMRSCAVCKALLRKNRLCDSVRCQCGWIW